MIVRNGHDARIIQYSFTHDDPHIDAHLCQSSVTDALSLQELIILIHQQNIELLRLQVHHPRVEILIDSCSGAHVGSNLCRCLLPALAKLHCCHDFAGLGPEYFRAAFGEIPTQTREVMRISWLGMLAHLNAGRPSLVAAAKKNGEGILGGINAVLNVPGGMHAVGGRAVDSLSSGMGSKRGSAVGSVRNLMQSMVTAAGSVSFTGIGGNVVGGILKGINNKAPTLMSRARNLATGIAETIRGALNVNSPSKVMIPMGQAVAEGMEVGLMQGAKGLYETASAISLETAETLGSISTRGVNYASAHSMNYGDRLDRLLDAVQRLADSQTTMEIDGRPFGRLVRSQAR